MNAPLTGGGGEKMKAQVKDRNDGTGRGKRSESQLDKCQISLGSITVQYCNRTCIRKQETKLEIWTTGREFATDACKCYLKKGKSGLHERGRKGGRKRQEGEYVTRWKYSKPQP